MVNERKIKEGAWKFAMEKYKISIVVPVYNIEDYLEACIESLINQTYSNTEILLIDDGSTDSSGEICDKYQKCDSRIKVIHKKNEGVVSARKCGGIYATGDYISSVDGDDWIEPDRIMHLAKKCLETEADMIYMEGYYKDYDTDWKSVLVESDIEEGYFSETQIPNQIIPMLIDINECFRRDVRAMLVCWGIKRELYKQSICDIDNRVFIGDDYACILCCLFEANSVFLMREKGYHYVQRQTSITHTLNRNSLHELKLWFGLVKKKLLLKDYSAQIMPHIIFLEIWYIMNADYASLLELQNQYLYPYSKVKKGSQIAVLGAGIIGVQLINYLDENPNYSVVAWVDNYCTKQPLPDICCVEKVDRLTETIFDYVVIVVQDVMIVAEIEQQLLELGIPEEKIAKMDAGAVMDNPLPEGF